MKQALETICWYNGHTTTFLNLAEELKAWNKKESFHWKHKWDTEEHFIWMILVSKFGDWDISINSGWIDYDKTNDAAEFLFDVFKTDIEQALFIKTKEGWVDNCV